MIRESVRERERERQTHPSANQRQFSFREFQIQINKDEFVSRSGGCTGVGTATSTILRPSDSSVVERYGHILVLQRWNRTNFRRTKIFFDSTNRDKRLLRVTVIRMEGLAKMGCTHLERINERFGQRVESKFHLGKHLKKQPHGKIGAASSKWSQTYQQSMQRLF